MEIKKKVTGKRGGYYPPTTKGYLIFRLYVIEPISGRKFTYMSKEKASGDPFIVMEQFVDEVTKTIASADHFIVPVPRGLTVHFKDMNGNYKLITWLNESYTEEVFMDYLTKNTLCETEWDVDDERGFDYDV